MFGSIASVLAGLEPVSGSEAGLSARNLRLVFVAR